MYWANNFVWTFDPREPVPFIPIELFPKQEELLRWMQQCSDDEVDGIVEKSRDMGVTWMCCIFLVHNWLFTNGYKGGIGSRKEDLVDKADEPDCIFEKIRMIVKRLPRWMLPKGFQHNKHDRHMLITNPERGCTISGEAGDNIGRGGRAKHYFIDEAAFIERAKKVDAALSQNTNVRFYVSTPNGNGNPFAQKRRAAAKPENHNSIRLFTLHWKSDPRKNYSVMEPNEHGRMREVWPWYERQKTKLQDPVVIAQELDIDYTASIEGICIPAKWVQAAIDFDNWLFQNHGKRLPRTIRKAGYDVAEEGKNLNVFTVLAGRVVTNIISWNFTDTTVSAKYVVQYGHRYNIERLNFDNDGVGLSISGALKSGGLGQRFEYYGVKNGGTPSLLRWPDAGESTDTSTPDPDYMKKRRTKTSKDKFLNARAENWWLLRIAFEKTYEYKELGVMWPLEELISIPDHLDLIDQLSSVLYQTQDNGKIKIESKKDMKVRNVDSPDYADSLVFAHVDRKITAKIGTATYTSESWG